jgi:hypothetical protein
MIDPSKSEQACNGSRRGGRTEGPLGQFNENRLSVDDAPERSAHQGRQEAWPREGRSGAPAQRSEGAAPRITRSPDVDVSEELMLVQFPHPGIEHRPADAIME